MRAEDEFKDEGCERRRKALFLPKRCSRKARLLFFSSSLVRRWLTLDCAMVLGLTATLLFLADGSLGVSLLGLLAWALPSSLSLFLCWLRRHFWNLLLLAALLLSPRV
jgi:hypothetical protein